jgi:hypothetical protein
MDEPTGDPVANLVEAARALVDAYRRQATDKEDFERLARAVDALGERGPAAERRP